MRCILSLICSLLLSVAATAQDLRAVVRLSSHGCSATVIHVDQTARKSYLLSCAHAFEGQDRAKKIIFETVYPAAGLTRERVSIRLLRCDYQADLTLIEVGTVLPYVLPVASATTRPVHCLSVGYSEMQGLTDGRAVDRRPVEVQQDDTRNGVWLTIGRPVEGQSGGALVDRESRRLVGVVQGYQLTDAGTPTSIGMFVDLVTIYRFMGWTTAVPSTPQLPSRPYPSPSSNPPVCPGGS